MLQHERDQKKQLEEMVEQLARQHSHLEEAAHRHRPSKLTSFSWRIFYICILEPPINVFYVIKIQFVDPVSSTTSDDDENEFYDAQELSEADGTFCLKMPPNRSLNDINGESSSESEELNSCETEPQSNQTLQVSTHGIINEL